MEIVADPRVVPVDHTVRRRDASREDVCPSLGEPHVTTDYYIPYQPRESATHRITGGRVDHTPLCRCAVHL